MADAQLLYNRDGRRRQSVGVQGTVRFRTSFRNVIYDVFRARAWKETDSETDWDVFWADVGWIRENFDNLRLNDHQRVNHFRNHYELTRKACTCATLPAPCCALSARASDHGCGRGCRGRTP